MSEWLKNGKIIFQFIEFQVRVIGWYILYYVTAAQMSNQHLPPFKIIFWLVTRAVGT
jgi:hypothetical protein